MKPFTKEYVDFAEVDWETVEILAQSKDSERFAAHIAHYCHQTADRYLKAWLIEHDIRPRKSGDLRKTLRLLKGETIRWRDLLESLDVLSGFETATQGPGPRISVEDAKRARETAEIVRNKIRERLGLD